MWVFIMSMLLITQPTIQSEQGSGFNLYFDYAIFKESDTLAHIEFYFKIPYSALVFERRDSVFVGSYLITAQLKDERNEPLADKVWQKEIVAGGYEQSQQSDGYDDAQLNFYFKIPKKKKLNSSIKIEDLNSARQKTLNLSIALLDHLSGLRINKFGKPNPNRDFLERDTVEVYWEVYNILDDYDTCSIALLLENKILTSYLVASNKIWESGQNRIAGFQARIPLNTDQELESGIYQIRVIYKPTKEKKITEINLSSPFYLSTRGYLEKIDELRYIATDEEMKQLRKAAASERQKFWQEFWKEKDPTPTTEENEVMDDYFKRIEYCKEKFGKGDRGYKSDRARVFMKYGTPDQIESANYEQSTRPYEIWYYYNINRRFVFVDVSGFGEYVLTWTPEPMR
jgi:GWxTD domain-containing protein